MLGLIIEFAGEQSAWCYYPPRSRFSPPRFPCTAYAVEEGADNDIVERDSTEGSGAFVGGGLAQDSNDYAGKQRKIRIHRLSKAKTRRRRKNYLDGNGTVCPGITILTTAV